MQPFVSRRGRLQKNLESSDGILIQQPNLVPRNHDVHYPFHPDRHFYYLTGFEEPNAWLLITKDKTTLWSPPQNEKTTLWEGPVVAENAISELQVDEWESLLDLQSLQKRLDKLDNLFLLGNLPDSIQFSGDILEAKPLIDKLRILKDAYEIDVISKACDISANAHNYLMANTTRAKHETELMGYFLQSIMSEGAQSLAYPPIIASGQNALILHYTKNNATLSQKDLILVDAGCEYQQYASDISRTFPANGKFSKTQQALYEACLDVQTHIIDKVKPGMTLQALHEASVLGITQHLIDLKIIDADLDIAIEEKLFLPYYPHRVGHTLGLDVHDIALLDRPLEPGMIITIEPGIYVRSKSIGIRIEDNILITESGSKNLTSKACKTISDIEKMMQS